MSVETYRLYLELAKRIDKLEREVAELHIDKLRDMRLEDFEEFLIERDHKEIAERIKRIEDIPDEVLRRITTVEDLYKMEEETKQGFSYLDEYLKKYDIKNIDFTRRL